MVSRILGVEEGLKVVISVIPGISGSILSTPDLIRLPFRRTRLDLTGFDGMCHN